MKRFFMNKKDSHRLMGGAISIETIISNITNNGNVSCHKAGQVVGRIYSYPTIYVGLCQHVIATMDGIVTVLY